MKAVGDFFGPNNHIQVTSFQETSSKQQENGVMVLYSKKNVLWICPTSWCFIFFELSALLIIIVWKTFWPTTFPTLKLNVPGWFGGGFVGPECRKTHRVVGLPLRTTFHLCIWFESKEVLITQDGTNKVCWLMGREWANISAGAIIVNPLKICKNYLWPDTKARGGRGWTRWLHFWLHFSYV